MVNPVIASDGHTYERSAIQEYLMQHRASPVIGVTLKNKNLVPNVVIKMAIAQMLQSF